MRLEFPLRPRWGVLIPAIVLFTACAAFLVHLADRGRGLVLNRLFHLDPAEARLFYLVLAALSMALVVLGALGALRQRGDRLRVAIEDDTITVPGTLFRPAAKTIRFAEITEVRDQEVNGQVFITLVHPGGKAWIHSQSVGDASFAKIRRILETRLETRAARR